MELKNCLFCNLESSRVIASNDFAIAFMDGFPVTRFHTLVIPKRHSKDYFELTPEEILACYQLLKKVKDNLSKDDPSIEGFNVGINEGSVAGQTVFHCHIHLIPRRKGDVENPKGGVRNTIPGKGDYFDEGS